ncbi:MAG: VCBS repeat-containing protein, partial [Acidobacteria bacterium]|nr:VCBS repeat-containing protein [Acidobacteriota bacterium]
TVATTRQQGSALSNSSIANVNDADQTASTLAVTVNGGTTATVNGVAVSGLSINAAGVVSANVSAACTATNANFTLTVTDNAAASVNATLNITVTANSAPSLSYGNQAVSAGGALNVSPASAIDNGSITGFALVSVTPALITAPTVTGAGVVVITNAAPATIHTLIIRATDNCGATTDASFTLNVGCPTITVNPASLPGGTTGAVYPNQTFMASGGVAPYSFSVSMGALPNGLTLSGAGVLAGTPTTAGLFNFTITATDANICLSAHTYPLTINQAVLAKAKKADFDGDGKTDLSIFSPSAAPPLTNWSVINSSNGLTVTQQWGAGYAPYFDDIVPGDYDGDGKADHAIWRGADSIWYIRKSSDGQAILQFWGANYAPYFDIPTPGDYDGDGKTDIAVFRRSGTWFVRRSSDGQNMIVTHGQQDDIPVPADYDGDGKTDLAVFRPGAIAPAPNWIILNSSTNTVTSIQWGAGYAPYFDTPVPADYDGDGKADLAIWRGADSIWYIRKSTDGLPILDLWGANYAPYFDIPTPGDYDGDGKADIAVWRRSGTWFVKRSSNGSFLIQNQGQSGDVPVPAYGVR